VHVHVDDVATVLAAASEAGRPSAVRVTRFADGSEHRPVEAPVQRVVLAVASGQGLRELFERSGARVLDGHPGRRPAPDRLLEALLQAAAAEVLLLPNDPAGLVTAEAAAAEARAAGVRVAVVPSASAVQGLAAVAVAEPSRSLEEDARQMSAAAQASRWAEVVLARGSAITAAGTCLPGDALGVQDGEVVLIGADVRWVARGLLDRLAPGAELLTVVLGAGTPAVVGDHLVAHAAQHHPALQVVVLPGGQEHCAVLLGAE
jgi:dihydroxyacetone kinase-like predicted kinase